MTMPDYSTRVGNDAKSVLIHLTTGTGMEIEWKDGHRSVYTFAFLREACPCALCEDERGKSGRKAGEAAKLAPGALPMFKPAVKALAAEAVGKYALRFSWNDKHDLGIYSWFYLRDVCPCAECAAARGGWWGLRCGFCLLEYAVCWQFVEEPFVVRSLKAAKPRGFLALQKAGPSLRSG